MKNVKKSVITTDSTILWDSLNKGVFLKIQEVITQNLNILPIWSSKTGFRFDTSRGENYDIKFKLEKIQYSITNLVDYAELFDRWWGIVRDYQFNSITEAYLEVSEESETPLDSDFITKSVLEDLQDILDEFKDELFDHFENCLIELDVLLGWSQPPADDMLPSEWANHPDLRLLAVERLDLIKEGRKYNINYDKNKPLKDMDLIYQIIDDLLFKDSDVLQTITNQDGGLFPSKLFSKSSLNLVNDKSYVEAEVFLKTIDKPADN